MEAQTLKAIRTESTHRRRRLLPITMVVVFMIVLLSFSTNAPLGRTGAPDESTCSASGCHDVGDVFDGEIIFNGFPAAIPVGQTFDVSVSVTATKGGPVRGGMSMTALGRVNGELMSIGNFMDAEFEAVIQENANGRQYFSHSMAKFFDSDSICLLYTSPSPRDQRGSRMPSSA